MKLARRAFQVLVAAVGVGLLFGGWFWIEANARIEDKRVALQRELPGILAADEPLVASMLVNDPLFALPTGEDAGPVLNDRLGWDGGAGDLVTADCRELLQGAGREWRGLTRSQVASCDTAWLHELRRFGKWSLTAGHRSRLPPGPRSEFALPELIDLQWAIKLHLLGAHDAEEAAQDVRHLARLLFTHSYLLSTMIGFSLLSIEETSWELGGKTWSAPPLTASTRDVLRRHLFSATFAMSPLATPEISARTIEGVPGFRRCLLLTEQSFGAIRSDLPAERCDFEHARWELAHPRVREPGDHDDALSWPARRGAWLVSVLAPKHYRRISDLLAEADELPASDRWASGETEFVDRMLRR